MLFPTSENGTFNSVSPPHISEPWHTVKSTWTASNLWSASTYCGLMYISNCSPVWSFTALVNCYSHFFPCSFPLQGNHVLCTLLYPFFFNFFFFPSFLSPSSSLVMSLHELLPWYMFLYYIKLIICCSWLFCKWYPSLCHRCVSRHYTLSLYPHVT